MKISITIVLVLLVLAELREKKRHHSHKKRAKNHKKNKRMKKELTDDEKASMKDGTVKLDTYIDDQLDLTKIMKIWDCFLNPLKDKEDPNGACYYFYVGND